MALEFLRTPPSPTWLLIQSVSLPPSAFVVVFLFIIPPNICSLLHSGEPDPPKKMDVLEITKNSATLGWLKPLRDGGAKINGYVVDYQEEGAPEDKWTPYSVVKDLTIVVVGLKEGKKYKFRVAARNSVGVSLAREAEGVFEVKEQLSEYTNVEICLRVQ